MKKILIIASLALTASLANAKAKESKEHAFVCKIKNGKEVISEHSANARNAKIAALKVASRVLAESEADAGALLFKDDIPRGGMRPEISDVVCRKAKPVKKSEATELSEGTAPL